MTAVVSGLSRSLGCAQRLEFFVPLVIVNELRSKRIEHSTQTVCDSTREGSWSERLPTLQFSALPIRKTVIYLFCRSLPGTNLTFVISVVESR